MKLKALVIASYPAPYRVAVFKELAKVYQLEIYFDTNKNEDRNADWFCKNDDISFDILDNEKARGKFNSALKNIKQYDFVLAYDPARKPSIRAILKCRIKNVPYFINNDGAFINKHNPIKTIAKHILYSGAKLCFASGKSSADYFMAYGVKRDKIRYHNFTSLTDADILKAPVSEVEKKAVREELQLKEDKTYIITVGQFVNRKGIDLLLEAWQSLKNNPCAELLIIGGGGKRKEYEEYISSNDMQNVTIIDFLHKEVLLKYYKASDIFILPTREDVWGLVINESMACGLPVVSSDMCIAARELVVNGENGFIYPVYDIEKMASCLQTLVADEKLRKTFAENNVKKMQGNTMENIGKKHCEDINNYFEAVKNKLN